MANSVTAGPNATSKLSAMQRWTLPPLTPPSRTILMTPAAGGWLSRGRWWWLTRRVAAGLERLQPATVLALAAVLGPNLSL